MTRYRVRVSEEAEQDLIDIYRYVAIHDSADKAAYVLEQLEPLCSSLAELPMRAHIPPELDRLDELSGGSLQAVSCHLRGHRTERLCYCVLDGRRDTQSLLERRLVR